MTILFYISGHGYGHATRMSAIIAALIRVAPEMRVLVRTEAPEWVFASGSGRAPEYFRTQIDAGVVESGLLTQDIPGTLRGAAALFARADEIVSREAAFLRQERVQLVICDLPPLASRIARAASIPCIAIGNFGWDEIYAPYVARHPEYEWLVEEIRDCYSQTELLLRLPWSLPMTAFPHRQDIPLVARAPQISADRSRGEIDALVTRKGRPHVLLGGRFPSLDAGMVARVLREIDVNVLSFLELPLRPEQGFVYLGPAWQHRFVEALHAADVVVSKLGYGIASECATCRTRVLYPPREDFAEQPAIEAGLGDTVPIQRIERDAFECGDWASALEGLLKRPVPALTIRTDGATVAAEVIAERVR